MSEEDCLQLVAMFDEDGGGTLSGQELMVAIRKGSMGAKRHAMVAKTFAMLMRDAGLGPGEAMPVDWLRPRFNAFADPRVAKGDPEWPSKDVANNFFAVLDDAGDGVVSEAEFFEMSGTAGRKFSPSKEPPRALERRSVHRNLGRRR